MKRIEELNSQRKKPSDAIFGINKFTDLMKEELPLNDINFIKKENSVKRDSGIVEYGYDIATPEGDDLPKFLAYCGSYVQNNIDRPKIDFCKKDFDQGYCGSCYAASQANLAQYLYANLTYKEGKEPTILNFGIQVYLNDSKCDDSWCNSRCCGGNPASIYKKHHISS